MNLPADRTTSAADPSSSSGENPVGRHVLPTGLERVRTTEVFDHETLPKGLLRAHRVAKGVWGQLIVKSGSLDFVFEDDAATDETLTVCAGESMVIPPEVHHHVEVTGPVGFVIEFYRRRDTQSIALGHESSGLEPDERFDSEGS